MKDILKTPYNREELINFIIDNSGEEFETLADVWEVAKETDSQLAGRVRDIIEYQIEEGEIDTDELFREWSIKVWEDTKYETEQILKFKDYYQNLLSYEENLKNFEEWLDN